MKILITGGAGFIGSMLVRLLLNAGAEVRVADNLVNGKRDNLETIENDDKLSLHRVDIRETSAMKALMDDVDIVFHLAALIAIPYSYSAPQSYVETNISGTLNLCQAAVDNQVSRFVHTSTSEVYGTAQYVPIDEKHPLQAQSPYSASKIGADAMAMSFYNAFDLPLSIARPFNTYGPRQSARAIIPTIISQIANGEKKIKLGDLTPTRDFNYVADTCRGFLAIAESEQAIGEVINIGSNFEISMADTLNLIKEIMHSDVEFVTDMQRIRPEKSEVFRLWCDNNKIIDLTGFTPKFSIKEGLTETVNWFLKPDNLKQYKHNIYNV